MHQIKDHNFTQSWCQHALVATTCWVVMPTTIYSFTVYHVTDRHSQQGSQLGGLLGGCLVARYELRRAEMPSRDPPCFTPCIHRPNNLTANTSRTCQVPRTAAVDQVRLTSFTRSLCHWSVRSSISSSSPSAYLRRLEQYRATVRKGPCWQASRSRSFLSTVEIQVLRKPISVRARFLQDASAFEDQHTSHFLTGVNTGQYPRKQVVTLDHLPRHPGVLPGFFEPSSQWFHASIFPGRFS